MKSKAFYPVVTSLKNCVPGVVYSTKKHGILKPLENNRGEGSGFVPSRVNDFIGLIDNGKFLFGTIHVLVNLKGDTIDGNNKNEALRQKNHYVNFVITNEPKFNVDDPNEILDNVAELNFTSSRWTPNETFKSALRSGLMLPKVINDLQNEMCFKHSIDPRKLSVSRIMSLVTNFEHGYKNTTFTRSSYNNQSLVNIALSDSFRTVLDLVCEIMKLCKPRTVREWDVIIQLCKKYKNDKSLNVIDLAIKFNYVKVVLENKPVPYLESVPEIKRFINTF